MAKKNKKQSKIGLDTEYDKFVEDRTVKWEDLLEFRTDAVNALREQTILLSGLKEEHKDIIVKDDSLRSSVDGLNKTYIDIADAIRSTMEKHMTIENNTIIDYKKGVIKDTDSEFSDWITISGMYTGAMETVANIGGKAYLDIFTKLKINTEELEKVMTSGQEEVKTITDKVKRVVNGRE